MYFALIYYVMTFVGPSVPVSVTLVNCDHIITQCSKKWKSAYDGIDRYLDYLHAEADADRSVPM